MRCTFGKQQGDTWLRARVGRITGSRLADVCSYLTRASGAKKAGDSSAKRDGYRRELIGERLSGLAANHSTTPAMEWGSEQEENARLFYEGVMRQMCEPVGLVLHPEFDFTGASPDSLVGDDGVLEIKCPETQTHLEWVEATVVPEKYMPQIMWELVCTGRQYVDFVSYDPRIQDDNLKFFYRRLDRHDAEWTIGSGKEEIKLTGQAVLDYFTNEVLKLNGEIEEWMQKHGSTPVAPFPVEILQQEEEPSGEEYLTEADFVGLT